MIVDASVAARWYLGGPHGDVAERLAAQTLHAPDLVIAQTLNAIWKAVRFGVGDAVGLAEAADDLPRRFASLEPAAQLGPRAAEIALELEHPVYDCLYLALSEMRSEPLVTADARLWRKASLHAQLARQVVYLSDWRA